MFPYKYSLKWEFLDDADVVNFVEETTKPIKGLIEPIDETKRRRTMNQMVSTMNSYIPQMR